MRARAGDPHARLCRGAALWQQRWRMFWMVCADCFGYAGGREWLVAHEPPPARALASERPQAPACAPLRVRGRVDEGVDVVLHLGNRGRVHVHHVPRLVVLH